MQYSHLLTPARTRLLNYVFMFFCFAACGVLFLRNLPYQSALTNLVKPINDSVMDPLGLYHRGWGMFPGGTTGSIMVRVRYTFKDGSVKIEEPFPLRSSLVRSAWNEVLEVILIRDNKNDPQRNYRFGYFQYQCRRADFPSPLVKAEVMQASIPLKDLIAGHGNPVTPPQFVTNYTMTCANNLSQP